MTIGERIAQIRKENGMSQEAFGEALGVSRQSISKWEANQTVPEVEKLISMHRLYGVSVGWLLGTEDSREVSGEHTEEQLRLVDEIARKYIDAIPRQEPQTPKYTRLWHIAAIVFMLAFIVNTVNVQNRFNSLDVQQQNLEYSIDRIQSSVDREVESIGHRVQTIIEKQNSILADYSAEYVNMDLQKGSVTLSFSAVPKTYASGMWVEFTVNDGISTQTVAAKEGANRLFEGATSCALTDSIDVSVILHYNDTEQTQLIQSWDYLFSQTKVYIDNAMWEHELWARHLTDFEEVETIPMNSWTRPMEVSVGDGLVVVSVKSVEHHVFLNGKQIQTVLAQPGISDFIINGMPSRDYAAQSDHDPFCGYLDAAFLSKMQDGDDLMIITVVTDSCDRRYIERGVAYEVASGRLEFSDLNLDDFSIEGVIDSLVKY